MSFVVKNPILLACALSLGVGHTQVESIKFISKKDSQWVQKGLNESPGQDGFFPSDKKKGLPDNLARNATSQFGCPGYRVVIKKKSYFTLTSNILLISWDSRQSRQKYFLNVALISFITYSNCN